MLIARPKILPQVIFGDIADVTAFETESIFILVATGNSLIQNQNWSVV